MTVSRLHLEVRFRRGTEKKKRKDIAGNEPADELRGESGIYHLVESANRKHVFTSIFTLRTVFILEQVL